MYTNTVEREVTMNNRTVLLSALISISFSLNALSVLAYGVGDVIEVQPSMMNDPSKGYWYRATVKAITPDGRLKVLADDGTEYLISQDPPKWIRAAASASSVIGPGATGSAPAGASGTTHSGSGNGGGGVPISGKFPVGGSAGSTASATKHNPSATTHSAPRTTSVQTSSPPASTSGTRAAKGAPPNGEYNCMKISSGQLIHLGTLEIRNGTYRGLDKTGGFAPMNINGAGNITWSQGFRGMPDGWQLKESRYVGGDSMGRPLIQIYYRSKSGWNEMMDALKEN